MTPLRAPFPWFGGKSRVAYRVWDFFGDVPNYVEPFFGSGAVLFGRPYSPRTETVNDKDCYLANFWRAVQHDPDAVAYYCDGPVNEADLHARHRWLVARVEFRERMMTDPEFFDARIAGWWCWGISQWIGSGWCSRPEWLGRSLPGRAARGVHAGRYSQASQTARSRDIAGSSDWRKRPAMRRGSPGILRKEFQLSRQIPQLSGDGGAAGRGIHAVKFRSENSRAGQWQTRPFLSHGGQGVISKTISSNLADYMQALCDRLRAVRVCCGDWQRILGPSPTTCIGVTGVFLDPPYSGDSGRDASIYSVEDLTVAKAVAKWCIEHGDNPKLRIALCGYEGEHQMPKSWTCLAWKANGGYGNQANGDGRKNAARERIWFSPHCLKPGAVLALGGRL